MAGLIADWPVWSLQYLLGTGLLASGCLGVQCLQGGRPQQASKGVPPGFRRFQLRFLAVYLLVMLADWLQGTNMYTLYESYGVNTSLLFITGFSSSALFGTLIGLFVDDYGRRLACMLFCALEVGINVLEHIPNMWCLLAGRVMGGLSTSLLFSSFESWMVAAHRKEGFPEELLQSTFALASTGNGIMAIVAGLLAQVSADLRGEIGPFQLAILLTIVAWVLITVLWTENKAERRGAGFQSGWQTLRHSMVESTNMILERPVIGAIGMSQALFEGAMYTFVFNWVPTLLELSPTRLPTGLIFSSFMFCVTVGGMAYGFARHVPAETTAHAVFLVSAASMAVAAMSQSLHPTMASFLVFEACVGVSYACLGILRSKYIPESHMASILNLMRLPLNLFVVVGTKLSDIWSVEKVFWICAAWHVGASIFLYAGLRKVKARSKAKTQ